MCRPCRISSILLWTAAVGNRTNSLEVDEGGGRLVPQPIVNVYSPDRLGAARTHFQVAVTAQRPRRDLSGPVINSRPTQGVKSGKYLCCVKPVSAHCPPHGQWMSREYILEVRRPTS